MEKVFKCVDDESYTISNDAINKQNKVTIEIRDYHKHICSGVSLSKPDAIEFCRELLKQIAMLE